MAVAPPTNPRMVEYLATTENWHDEIVALRAILLDCGLGEDFKWNKPTYTHEGANVSIIFRYKEFCALGFLKGSLMKDPKKVFVAPGANSRAMRMIRFTSAEDISALEPGIRTYVAEALRVEKAGLKVEFDNSNLDIPAELEAKFRELPPLKTAFEALTPGRQRGYVLHIGGAKQAATRESRVEACTQAILDGKGLNDR